MECMRAMSSVCPGSMPIGMGRSHIANGVGEAVSFRGRLGGLMPLRVQKVQGRVQGNEALKVFTWRRRSGVAASSSGVGMTPEEPLDYSVDKAADDAEKEFGGAKDSIGRSAENLKEKAGSELDESKQSFSSTVDDVKREAGKAKSSAEDIAQKELERLKDITNQLLEQAETARQKLAATAQETAYKQKDNLAYVAENGPEPVKEVAESALDAHYSKSEKSGSKIHDFCLGIPYGIFLAAGGLLWFILSGGTSALRFGVLLGSGLLYLSVTSLKKWKNGESSMAYIQGQAAITAFIFLRYYRRYGVNKVFFPTGVVGLVSGAMLAFYIYVLVSGGNPPPKKSKIQPS